MYLCDATPQVKGGREGEERRERKGKRASGPEKCPNARESKGEGGRERERERTRARERERECLWERTN